MKIAHIFLLCAGISALALPLDAESADQFCPTSITEACLADIADRVIANQPDENTRAALAQLYAAYIQHQNAGETQKATEMNFEDSDWRSLRRSGRKLGNKGQFDQAHKFFWAAAQTRAKDPKEREKILDILLIAENAANIDDLALARAVHELAAQHLPQLINDFVPFTEELRLARLMGLYGWPEAAHPLLDSLYRSLSEIPAQSLNYGYTLTRLIEISILVAHDNLLSQLEADLSVFLQKVDQKTRDSVQPEYVASLARAGHVTSAQDYAAEHGIAFSQALRGASHFFLRYGSDYYPGISDDVLRRFELMLAAIDDPEIKAAFLIDLAIQLIQDEEYARIQEFLDRVEDRTTRSEMVLSLMKYHAREKNDAKTAADLFFAEQISLVPRFPHLGTSLLQYPISLTAQGLLESGDTERGVVLADLVLELWLNDQSKRRRLDTPLIGALAMAGEQGRIDKWIAASYDPMHRISVVVAAASERARAGLSVDRDAVIAFSNDHLPLITDRVPSPPIWWPKYRPYPSPREEARQLVQGLDHIIVKGLAENVSIDDARQAFADFKDRDPYPWVAQLALAKAELEDGQEKSAHQQRLAVLDMLLSGRIEAKEMPTILFAIHQ